MGEVLGSQCARWRPVIAWPSVIALPDSKTLPPDARPPAASDGEARHFIPPARMLDASGDSKLRAWMPMAGRCLAMPGRGTARQAQGVDATSPAGLGRARQAPRMPEAEAVMDAMTDRRWKCAPMPGYGPVRTDPGIRRHRAHAALPATETRTPQHARQEEGVSVPTE